MAMDDTLEAILRDLIAIDSTADKPEQLQAVIKAVEAQLATVPELAVQTGHNDGVPYLVATTREPNSDMLWVVSHLDVVPAGKQAFILTDEGDNYRGRGVFDMKGAAAATIAAIKQIDNLAKYNLGLMFTTDEEVGGQNGVGQIIRGGFEGGVVYVFDGGEEFCLMEQMKGVFWLQLNASGKAAHASRPWEGQSANQVLVDFLASFSDWFKTNISQDHPQNYFTTYNIGTIQGGEAVNQVSDKAEATLDIRTASGEDLQKIKDGLKSLSNNYAGIKMAITVEEPPVVVDPNGYWPTLTKKLIQELKITSKQDEKHRFGHGSTDGRYFSRLGIPVITTRPLGGGHHGKDEWVSKAGLNDLQKLIFNLFIATGKR